MSTQWDTTSQPDGHYQNDIITSAGEDVEKLEPSYIAGRNLKWYSYLGKQSGSSSKCLMLCHQMNQQSHFKVYTQEKWKHMSHWNLFTNVHSSIIHSSQKVKTTQCSSTDEWMNKMWLNNTVDYYSAIKSEALVLQHG